MIESMFLAFPRALRSTGRRCLWVLLMAALACNRDPGGFRPLAAGDPAPDFGAPVFDGDSLHLSSLAGQPVLLNVWATWCPPCREEMPALQALHEEFGPRGLRVVGVSVDSRGSEDTIRRFLEEGGYTFTILHDASDAVSRQFRTIGVPESFLIDGEGRVVRRWIGKFDPLAEDVVRDIEALLPPG
ncbi:MAG TPA: TlpA disulfide reductase family protein [Longimicrobiales bacterium]|nr:TlpA disulfide reductase family protein [Longimicrobiales bacterium]